MSILSDAVHAHDWIAAERPLKGGASLRSILSDAVQAGKPVPRYGGQAKWKGRFKLVVDFLIRFEVCDVQEHI
jgi:hypothetical protein